MTFLKSELKRTKNKTYNFATPFLHQTKNSEKISSPIVHIEKATRPPALALRKVQYFGPTPT